MQSVSLFYVLCLATVALAYPYLEVVENENGEVFHLVPLNRVRRSGLYGNIDITDPGRAIVGARGTPINNANHRLDTHVFATDNIRHHSPLTVGGEANYLHKPSQSTFGASAVHTERWGTDLKAAGRYNFHQGRTTNANVEAFASKHIGGIPGNGRLSHGVMFNFKKNF